VTVDGWSSLRLGDLITLKRGYDLPTPDRVDTGSVPVVSSSGICGWHDEPRVQSPGVVTGRYGSVGAVFLLEQPFWPLNTTLYVQDFKGNDEKFVFYYLQSLPFERYSDKTSVPGVNRNDLHRIWVKRPPLPEQRAIAAILSTWDEAIALTVRLIAALQQRKRGLMQRLLTGEVRFPEFGPGLSERQRLPDGWNEAPLRKLFKRITRNVPDDVSHVLSITATVGFVDQREKFGRVIAGKNLSRYVLLHHGEFSYNKGNSKSYPQGCVYMLEEFESGAVPNVYYSFAARPDRVHAPFYKYYFEQGLLNHQLARVINTGVRNDGLLNLSADDFFSAKVFVPPLPEQVRIAEALDTASAEIESVQRRLQWLSEQKKGLMQRLLTGQIRVQVDDT